MMTKLIKITMLISRRDDWPTISLKCRSHYFSPYKRRASHEKLLHKSKIALCLAPSGVTTNNCFRRGFAPNGCLALDILVALRGYFSCTLHCVDILVACVDIFTNFSTSPLCARLSWIAHNKPKLTL